MRRARLAVLGAALGAVTTFGALEVMPHLSLVGEVSQALQGAESARKLPGGTGWVKLHSEGPRKMVLLNIPYEWMFGWDKFLGDAKAQRLFECNFVDCVYAPVNKELSAVVRVYPIPFVTDRVWVDTVAHGPTQVMRSRWDEVVTVK